jgi:hypothetical protein
LPWIWELETLLVMDPPEGPLGDTCHWDIWQSEGVWQQCWASGRFITNDTPERCFYQNCILPVLDFKEGEILDMGGQWNGFVSRCISIFGEVL